MKLIRYTLLTFILIVGYFVSQTEAIMEDKILEFLEEIRNRMCHPLFGIPALDPLQIKHVKFSMNNKYVVDFNASVTDFRLTGLSSFNVTNLKIFTVPLRRSNVTVVFPLTAVKSRYTAKGSLAYIVYLNGNSKANGHVGDLRISVSWILKTGLTVGIRSLKIEIGIGYLLVNIEDLMEEPRLNEFLYALLNEMGIELLNDIWLEAQDNGVIQYVEDTINKFLGRYTLSEIIKIIAAISGGGEPPFGGVPSDCKNHILI